MKTSRKFLLAVITASVLGVAPFALHAQTPPPPPPPAGDQTPPPPPPPKEHKDKGHTPRMPNIDMLKEHLSLTDDQVAKISPILDDTKKQLDALWADDSIAREDKRPKMQEIIKAMRSQIRPILTPDQIKTFEDMKEHGGKDHGPGGPGGPPAGAPGAGPVPEGPPPGGGK